jgi:Uma2 family endonuclease
VPRKNGTVTYTNFGELLHALGDIPPSRIRLTPPPGQATERDLLRLNERKDSALYELVEGTLVEKAVGLSESGLSVELGRHLCNFAELHDLGLVAGEAGSVRLFSGLVRLPDVLFVSWGKLPGKTWPREPIPDLAPDLAVEILSKSNTKGEIRRKLKEYFLAGVRLVWVIDPKKRLAQVYTAPDRSEVVSENGSLTGGDVLPGFALTLNKLFARLPPPASGKKPRRR